MFEEEQYDRHFNIKNPPNTLTAYAYHQRKGEPVYVPDTENPPDNIPYHSFVGDFFKDRKSALAIPVYASSKAGIQERFGVLCLYSERVPKNWALV